MPIDGIKPQYNEDFQDNSPKASKAVKSLTEALAWANAQRGKSIDIDGFPSGQPYQCVDLAMAYSRYLFGSITTGNAADYAQRNYAGFSRLSKSQTLPQAGDLAIWTGGYGHVGIVIASSGANFTTLEQNVSGNYSVQEYHRNSSGMTGLNFWGVQRPQLDNGKPVPAVAYAVHRLYNANNGDHYYSTDQKEAEALRILGLHYDGVAFHSAKSGRAVYKAYNPNSGEHFYSANEAEIKNIAGKGWKNEGRAWLSPIKGQAVYRLYNPNGFHFWTLNHSENRHSLHRAGGTRASPFKVKGNQGEPLI